MWGPSKNVGPIGSAVLTFIGHKQTNRQTHKQSINVEDIWIKNTVWKNKKL